MRRFKTEQICLGVLVAAFAVVAFWLNAGKDLWLDELFTWYQVRDKNFHELLAATKTGFNLIPLGHFALLWGMGVAHCLTPLTARMVSILSIVLGLALFIRIWTQIWDAQVAVILASILVGASAPLLDMAIEVRPYALAFLISAAALYCTIEINKSHARGYLLFSNGLCAFLLPWLSYPSGIFSAAMLAGVWLSWAQNRQRPSWSVIASYLAGWTIFALTSSAVLAAQVGHNGIGIHHQAPRLADLLTTYSNLVSFPLGVVIVLLLYFSTSNQPPPRPPVEASSIAKNIAVPWPLALLILVPLILFSLAKLHLATVWGDRFVLATAPAVASVAGPLVASWLLVDQRPKKKILLTTTAVAIASLVLMAIPIHSANNNTAVRQIAAKVSDALPQGPLVTAEMNTYFHLLHYPLPGVDVRLAVANAADQELIRTYNKHIQTITPTEALALPTFVILEGDDQTWSANLLPKLDMHGLRVAESLPVDNLLIHQMLRIQPSTSKHN